MHSILFINKLNSYGEREGGKEGRRKGDSRVNHAYETTILLHITIKMEMWIHHK
jgi:hypothetical protein